GALKAPDRRTRRRGAGRDAAVTYEEKVAYLAEDLKAHGINPGMANPPWVRLLRGLGLPVRPPHFRTYLANVLCLTAFVVLLLPLVWGAAVVLLLVFCGGISVTFLVICTFASASMLAKPWVQAGKWSEEARRLNLPAWEDYPREPLREEGPPPQPPAAGPDT